MMTGEIICASQKFFPLETFFYFSNFFGSWKEVLGGFHDNG
jgi:hypothetical protein